LRERQEAARGAAYRCAGSRGNHRRVQRETGEAFTRNPATGDKRLYGEFLVNAQDEDVVAGIRTPQSITEEARIEGGSDKPSLEAIMPAAFAQFKGICDTLAVAIGTSHGAYKFTHKPTGDVLAMNVIEAIHKRIPNTHLVMHGSSSVPKELIDIINEFGGEMPTTFGVPVEELQRGIKHGVRKVNIDTDLRCARPAQGKAARLGHPRASSASHSRSRHDQNHRPDRTRIRFHSLQRSCG